MLLKQQCQLKIGQQMAQAKICITIQEIPFDYTLPRNVLTDLKRKKEKKYLCRQSNV